MRSLPQASTAGLRAAALLRCAPNVGRWVCASLDPTYVRCTLPNPARVHVEVGLLLLQLGLQPAAQHVAGAAAHVLAPLGVEYQHAAEHLEHCEQALARMVGVHAAVPLAADREHLAVKPADRLVAVAQKRVVAAQIDEVALQPIELRLAVVDQEERE